MIKFQKVINCEKEKKMENKKISFLKTLHQLIHTEFEILFTMKLPTIEERMNEMIEEKLKNRQFTGNLQEENKNEIQKGITTEIINEEEKQQLEEWTNLKYGNILFDSDSDDWNDQKVFNSKIFGKKQILLIVEDENGNKFGGYVNATLNKIYSYTHKEVIKDEQSFLFFIEIK